MRGFSNYCGRGSRRIFCVLSLAAVLGACGGGGASGGGSSSSGSSSGGGGSGLRFNLDRSAISFDYIDTGPVPEQFVVATAVGNLPSTLYIGAQDQATYLNPQIEATLSNSQATFRIQPRANLDPGTYNGTLRLMACADQSCGRHLGNSPLSITYSMLVRPGLRVRPENLGVTTYFSGQEQHVTFTVQLPEGATAFTAIPVNGGSICRIGNLTASTFDLIASSVPAGDYLCQFQVDAGLRFTTSSINFHVNENPAGYRDLSVAEPNLTFTTVEGAASDAQRLHVTPSSFDGDIGIEVQGYDGNASGWLTTNAVTGGFDVIADGESLAEGTYSATLRVFGRSPHFQQSVSVPVSVTVGPGLVRPADFMPTVTNATAAADLGGSTLIQVADGPTVAWSATSDEAWLELTRAAGLTGTALQFDYDNAAFRALANGREHHATITVSTTNPAIAPVQFDVVVNKRLAQVSGLGPYLHVSGSPIRAYVRGIGFSAIGNLSSLEVQGAAGAVFTPVNDTTLQLQIPALAVGSYQVRVSNLLGAPGESRDLKVIAPVNRSYAQLPTQKPVGNVIFDAERDTVYVLDRGDFAGTLHRFRFDGTTWVGDTFPSPASSGWALSNDGTHMLEGEYPNVVRSKDPVTLGNTSEHMFDGTFHPTWQQGRQLAVTNDGRLWLPDAGFPWARRLAVFDPLFGEFSAEELPGSGILTTAELEVPRDGSRIVIGEIDGSQHGLGVLDAISGQYVNIAPMGTWGYGYRMHSSDDGSRISFNGDRVFDRDLQLHSNLFAALGAMVDDIEWIVAYGLMSPDGRRLYAIAYDSRDLYVTNTPLPPPLSRPRIFVVDTSSTQATPNDAAIIGYFEIDDYPACRTHVPCDPQTRGAISPDGRTLFYAGTDRLVVVPVPPENTLVAVQNKARPVMKRWDTVNR